MTSDLPAARQAGRRSMALRAGSRLLRNRSTALGISADVPYTFLGMESPPPAPSPPPPTPPESAPPLPGQLRDKALLALEDAIQECRYRTPRPSFAVRFALAYLWVYGGCDRLVFDELWQALRAPHTPWSFSVANRALTMVYGELGLDRPAQPAWRMWARWAEHENEER